MISDKLLVDYQSFNQNIEFLSQQAMQDIREKIKKIKKDAQALGETIGG
ncbi:MAG: hypothetical protein NWF01_00310 [Candidatus Bathyarchaeota archaeon]|nr:hypothetical protein [Candidatus Bathyarchaeota archaeon]